jgi:hypothetical protein
MTGIPTTQVGTTKNVLATMRNAGGFQATMLPPSDRSWRNGDVVHLMNAMYAEDGSPDS